MKKLMITAAALLVAVAAHAQGSFTFAAHSAANDVKFMLNGAPATGSDLFVEVLAGADKNSLTPLLPLLPLNRATTSTLVGYPTPLSTVFSTSLTGNAIIGYRAFQGTSYATAATKSDLFTTATPVALALAPNLPNEAPLGLGNVVQMTTVPEPATLALGLLGLGSLLMFRRRS